MHTMLRENILWATVIEHDGRIVKQDTFLCAVLKVAAATVIAAGILYVSYMLLAAL